MIKTYPEVIFNLEKAPYNHHQINYSDFINAIYGSVKCIKSDNQFVRVYNKKGFRLTEQFESP